MVMMILALSLLGLGAALFYTFRVSSIPLTQGIDSSEEADKLTRIHGAISKGAMAFLKEEYRYMLYFMVAFAVIIGKHFMNYNVKRKPFRSISK